MPIVSLSPFMRFEYKYGQYVTVIEGAEMAILDAAFRHFTLAIKEKYVEIGIDENGRPATVTMLACLMAYQHVYDDCVSDSDLRDLRTPDARKMDLFYKGYMIILGMTFFPNEDWEGHFGKSEKSSSIMEQMNEAVILKPAMFGVGINVNAIIDAILKKSKK